MKKYRRVAIFTLIILMVSLGVFNTLHTQAALQPGTYTIKDILAIDDRSENDHPKTIDDILRYVASGGKIDNKRTGWSAYELTCGPDGKWQKVNVTNTSDSGSDKTYEINDYYEVIIQSLRADGYDAATAEEIYGYALENNLKLKYQEGSKTDDPNGYEWTTTGTDNCYGSDDYGGYYNDVDFKLTLTFTIEEPDGPKLRIEPPSQTIYVGETAQYRAIYTHDDGKTEDVTDQAVWKAVTLGYASSDGGGKFTGVAKGSTTVTAVYDNRSATASLEVLEVGEEPEPEEPELPKNIPPVAKIKAPTTVEIGEYFCLKSESYDPDGEIVYWDWGFWGSYKDNDDELTEKSDGACQVYYDEPGEQEVILQVTDDRGAWDETEITIQVVYPIPDADFDVMGFPIENRKTWLQPERPYGSNEEAEGKFPIVENKWIIEALDSNNQSSIIVIEDDLLNSDYDENIELLFRKAGEYKVTHYIKNNRGSSDTAVETVVIEEDMLPTADIETSEVVYLNNQKKQTVTLVADAQTEDDMIGNLVWELALDSDNDSQWDDETFSVISNTAVAELNHTVTQLGDYKVRLTVFESFDEDTYESHVDLTTNKSTTHRKYKQVETVFRVDNMAPVASLTAKDQKEVEIIFNMGDVADNGKYTKSKLQTQINSTLLPKLAAEGINANIDVQERTYYKDVQGVYYRFQLDGDDYRYQDTEQTVGPFYYYMDFSDGILKKAELPKGFWEGQMDYDGNLYYNLTPKKTAPIDDEYYSPNLHWYQSYLTDDDYPWPMWGSSNVEIYKYDKETNTSSLFVDKNFIANKIMAHANGNKDRVYEIRLQNILVGENENIYLDILAVTDRIEKNDEYDEYLFYVMEFDKDGVFKNMNKIAMGNDYDDHADILSITNENIYFLQDGEDYSYAPVSTFWTTGSYGSLSRDVPPATRIISTQENDYYYGVDTIYDEPGLFRTNFNKSTKIAGDSLLFKIDNSYNFPGLASGYVMDFDVLGASRNGSLFTDVRITDDDNYYSDVLFSGYRIFDDKNFAMSNVRASQPMSEQLKTLVREGNIFFGEDGTYKMLQIGRVDVLNMPMNDVDKDVVTFDEKTNAYLSKYRPQTTDSIGPLCSWDDDDDECSWSYNKYFAGADLVNQLVFAEFGSETLPVRAYKKTLADTLAETEWKSETSTKYYVTLSDQNISDLPNENAEVAALLNQDDVRYISINTSSTQSVAQQIRNAIEQDSLQVTTTYTDTNVKNAMTNMGNFIVGDLFPPTDPTIDIHIGVDDSRFSLTAINSAKTATLEKMLKDAGFTDFSITTSSLKNTTVNNQNVRKFNTNKENEYYVLFKDSALSTQNLNHMVGDMLSQRAYFIGIGNSTSNATLNTALQKNMNLGKTIINSSDITKAMTDLGNYLIDTIRAREDESVIFSTTEVNKVVYQASYWDLENNPKFQEVYKTTHEPSVFENNQGKVSFGAGNLPQIFNSVGLYKPTYQAQDNPLVGYTTTKASQFANYRKWSNVADKAKVYIHRLPVPEFSVSVNINTNSYNVVNKAYDLDKQSINIGLGGGIAKQNWQWRKKGDLVWNNGLPPNPLAETVYEVKNEVTDFQGLTHYLIKELIPIQMPVPPVAEFRPNPSVIEQGNSVNFLNTSYEPTGQAMTAQWYYKKSNSSSYTLFATGSYANGAGNANWNPTTSALNSIGIYDIKLVVTDTEGLQDSHVEKVEVIEKSNTPPVACMNIPSPNYIGDTITITNCAYDVDGDPLTYTYEVTKPNGSKSTYATGNAKVASNGNLTITANVHPTDLGTWTVKQTVNDGSETASISGTFIVLDQTIQGQVAHTAQWLKNIQAFNAENPSKALNLNVASGLVEFIPGERFMLSSDESTTNRLTDVKVAIVNGSRGINYQSMYGNATLSRIDNNTFSGSMWHKSMIEQFINGETLTFRFTGTFSNGWVDTHDVTIKIRDEQYWRQHTFY